MYGRCSDSVPGRVLATLAAWQVATGCVAYPGPTDGKPGRDSAYSPDSGHPGLPPLAFEVEWRSEEILVTAEEPTPGWSLGLIAIVRRPADWWLGEDCSTGDIAPDGQHVTYCHELDATRTSIAFGGDASNLEPGTTAIEHDWRRDSAVAFLSPYYQRDPGSGYPTAGYCVVFGEWGGLEHYLGCAEIFREF